MEPRPLALALVIRIVGTQLPGRVCGPHRDVRVGLQVGKEVVQVASADAARVIWETEAALVGGVVRGKAIHGQRGERFLYLSWSGRAGAAKATMFRRAKLQLDAVDAKLLAKAAGDAGCVLEAQLGLTDERGLPRCASVRPPLVTWRVSAR
jgi:hypothetical protein